MATFVHTPRDRLQRLFDYGVRALRYWWIVAGFVVIGGALSTGYALTRHAQFESSSTLLYQELIQANVLQGRDASVQRNSGERYKELLLSHSQLAKIVEDPALFDDTTPATEEQTIEDLRGGITFEAHGQNVFRITYKDVDPDRAYHVTQKLTELLIAKETELRAETANATVAFAQDALDKSTQTLLDTEQQRAQFLVAHPEFAEDAVQGQSEGAAVRHSQEDDKTPASSGGGNPRLSALERQRIRIKARLDAADNPSPDPTPTVHTPNADEQSAQRKVDTAQEELRGAQRDLEAMLAKGMTENHPDVRKAKDAVTSAQNRLKSAQTELAAAKAGVDIVAVKPPASADERAALEKDLKDVESQIAAERARGNGAVKKPEAPSPSANDIADKVVQLETEWARLRREVSEQSQRVQTLNDSVFRAQLDAQTRMADEGAGLQIIDQPFLPDKPIGKGKKVLVLAGLFLFTSLGMAIAIGLAILDDRIYRRVDIEQLEVAPVLAVIPRAAKREKAPKGK